MKILLIEDDAHAATILTALVHAAWGATVVHATCGEQALRILGSDQHAGGAGFDLITLDLGLPDIDGLQLCRRVRHLTARDRVPILVISGHSDEEHLEAAFEAGATDYLAKPVRSRELYARIRAAMRDQRDHQRRSAATTRLRGVTAELRRSNQSLERLATVDPLTQIANRRQFDIGFDRAWRSACRIGSSIAVVMIDVDHFHGFNETHGHLAGDECLIQIAAALAAATQRPTDAVARWGGEEFVCVLPDADIGGARRVAERARAAVESLAIPNGGSRCSPHVTISAGAAAMRPHADQAPETLLEAADDALFQAKRLGRNRVCEVIATEAGHGVEVSPSRRTGQKQQESR